MDGKIEIPTWVVRLCGVALAVAIYIGAYKALAPEDRKAVRRAVASQAVQKIVPKSVQGEQMRVTPASLVTGVSAMGEQMRVAPDGVAGGLDAMGEQMRVAPDGVGGGLDAMGEQMRVTPDGLEGEQMRVAGSAFSDCEAEEDCKVRENDTPVGAWGSPVPEIERVAERAK
jgi:hypothetical protein